METGDDLGHGCVRAGPASTLRRFDSKQPGFKSVMTLRVTVNELKCQSYRRCTAVAPAVFGISAISGKAEVLHGGDASHDVIVQAARSCPYRAITVVDDAAGVQLFPPLRKPSPAQG